MTPAEDAERHARAGRILELARHLRHADTAVVGTRQHLDELEDLAARLRGVSLPASLARRISAAALAYCDAVASRDAIHRALDALAPTVPVRVLSPVRPATDSTERTPDHD